jgi:hypothetical protein
MKDIKSQQLRLNQVEEKLQDQCKSDPESCIVLTDWIPVSSSRCKSTCSRQLHNPALWKTVPGTHPEPKKTASQFIRCKGHK